MERDGGNGDHAMRHALHSPADLHLHPSTLTLSGYPTVGGGAAELVFTVTYAGDMRQGGAEGLAEPPIVRLDVTGSGYRDLYRVTNITSNIGTEAFDVFEPYDHESETVRAEQGVTYTVRAAIEFVAEGFIPVYALGFDGDIVTVDVATSVHESMSYYEYAATRQGYLDKTHATQMAALPHTSALSLDKWTAGDPLAPHPYSASPASLPFAESDMSMQFNATGTVMVNHSLRAEFMPVHGIEVCVFDESHSYDPPRRTLLSTTADKPACTYTDTSGRYEILNVGGSDPDGDATSADVVVSVKSFGYGGAINLMRYDPNDGMNYTYYARSDVEVDYGGTVLVRDFNLGDDNADDNGMAGAARIVSAISDGMAFFETYGQDPGNLGVWWNHMNGSRVFPHSDRNGAFYTPGEATITLNGYNPLIRDTYDHSNDRHTILHEYGHYVHDAHDPELDYYCLPHYFDKKHDEQCAWGEGWGQLVPHLVDGAAEVPFGVRNDKVNLETGRILRPSESTIVFDTFEASGRPIGEKVEGTVAAAMWDMVDDAADPVHDRTLPGRPAGGDNSSAGVEGLLGVFFDGTYDTFADFYDRWEIDMRHDSAENVAILHGMSFAIPSNMSYYKFAGELNGVFEYGLVSNLLFWPNYIDVSDDGSTVAITSLHGRGLQMVNARAGEHEGLYAAYGYDHACSLEERPRACMNNLTARATVDPGMAGFSNMDGIAFGLNSSLLLVSEWNHDNVRVIGDDGAYLGRFGGIGTDDGEFLGPSGIAFLADNTTVAVADEFNSRIQTFEIASDGSVQYSDQFQSYHIADDFSLAARQQLATGPDGTLYAAGHVAVELGICGLPSIWVYPSPHDSSAITQVYDSSLGCLGGIAVDSNGLVYVSDSTQGRIRVYDLDNLHEDVSISELQLNGRPFTLHEVQGGADAEAFTDEFGSRGTRTWQLVEPVGVALGPPDTSTGDVRVYVADMNGVKMYEKDRESPRVESVWAHTPDGTMIPGDVVEIALNFSERVTVMGMPALALETGATGSSALYVSGSGSHTLTFNYTVDADANPSYIDYEGTGSLSLSRVGDNPSAAIVDDSGNAANLTLPERGTAASLAANAALWIGASPTDAAPFGIEAAVPIAAVEHRQVLFDVVAASGSTPIGHGSYSMNGAPAGSLIFPNGTFTWMPDEAQDGMHAFAVRASPQTDSGISHTRAFRIHVAEDNKMPEVEPVKDRRAVALSEVRFDIAVTDDDLPTQTLEYCLGSNTTNNYATVLPNGTFVWTPSEYNVGTTMFNVTITDDLDGCSVSKPDSAALAEFTIIVSPSSPSAPLFTYVLATDGADIPQRLVYTAGQTIRIAIDFSEPVVIKSGPGGGTPYLELRTGAASEARASYDSGSGTKTLVFMYTVRDGDATDRLSYAGMGALTLNGSTITVLNSGEVASTALPETGSLGSLSDSSIIRIDAVRPAVESVFALTSDGTYGEGAQVDIAARFSENVTVAGSPAIMLETGATGRDAVYLSGNSTDTLVFRYTVQAGDNASRLDYTGTDALRADDGGSIRDWVGNNAILTLPTPGSQGSLGYNSNITIGIETRNETVDNTVTLNVGRGGDTGLISVVDSGDEARITLNLRGIAGPGGSGTATFPSDGITVNASFASVTFPPGATATSVPADNILVLYVADGVPDNSSVQRILGYDGPNPVAIQRVVEIGDEDGRVEFDAPVRISLEGLAGGRAFYVDGAGGAITPIDRACAADDLQRVQRQLDGAGECQLDSDGGDKIIYTYHLTRFGTVLSVSDAPAIPDHTCSMRLALLSLGVEGARPGVDSPAASQTVVNSGSLPFNRIELEATPWYVDLGEAEPGPDTRSLNASITEVREEEGGPYRTVYSRGTAVADGLGGGLEAPLWFRLNLAAHGDVHGVDLTQYVTYVAECGGPAGQR